MLPYPPIRRLIDGAGLPRQTASGYKQHKRTILAGIISAPSDTSFHAVFDLPRDWR